MTSTEARRALLLIGWNIATLARKARCTHTQAVRWLDENDRCALPPPIGRWLATMVELHEGNPPPEWRTKGIKI